MRFSNIKVGYIYNVIFDPVRNCEQLLLLCHLQVHRMELV